ncbi:MAG: molybdate ABC transporter permease subunit [Oleibacter sp.]|nr:molybdate ABC transporter permease subunit [Thalassolituus sp.]
MLTNSDWTALLLTVRLATVVTLILLVVCIPLAWWLARSRSVWRGPLWAITTLPLVLPPTVLGFYLLIALSPMSALGGWLQASGLPSLVFSFSGLVVASIIYSLPFVLQPIYASMMQIDNKVLDAATTLGAGPWNRFFYIVLPLSRQGILLAALLGFLHTVGEFGVVLMLGGNIPGETRVLSVQIYDYVESLDFAGAHRLSLILTCCAFLVLLVIYRLSDVSRTKRDKQ